MDKMIYQPGKILIVTVIRQKTLFYKNSYWEFFMEILGHSKGNVKKHGFPGELMKKRVKFMETFWELW